MLKLLSIKVICFSEKGMLIGEGEYNIEYLKEIKVTESYLGLNQQIRECQNEEPFYNCTTKVYLRTFLEECGCLPLNLFLLGTKV